MIITLFQSTTKAWIEDMNDVIDLKWEDVVEILLTSQNAKVKEDGTLYNLALFKSIGDHSADLGRSQIYKNGEGTGDYIYHPNTVSRCKNNLVAIYGMVLDFDEGVTIQQAIQNYDGLEYVLYTTFRHTIDAHRFRIVIPFTRPLYLEDVEKKIKSIKKSFPGVDNASFSASQSFYFHSGHNDPISFHMKGIMIDPYENFEDEIIVEPEYEIDNTKNYQYDDIYVDNLLTRIASKVGNLRGQYDAWRTIAWATCSVVGISNAKSLMMKHFFDKTKKEMTTLTSWKQGVGPKIGTLIKLSGISKEELRQLDLEYRIRHNIVIDTSGKRRKSLGYEFLRS